MISVKLSPMKVTAVLTTRLSISLHCWKLKLSMALSVMVGIGSEFRIVLNSGILNYIHLAKIRIVCSRAAGM